MLLLYAECVFVLLVMVSMQEVLALAHQQADIPVLHDAFSRLSDSLVAAAEKDEQLGRLARLWRSGDASLKLPWSRSFFRIFLKGQKKINGTPSSPPARSSGQLMRLRIEFSDYGEAVAASGYLLSPSEWRGGLRDARRLWGEVAGSPANNTDDILMASKATDTQWEQAIAHIRGRKAAEALNTAAISMALLQASPAGARTGFVERAIPLELFVALQLWEKENRAEKHRQPERLHAAPFDPLDFYGA